MKKTFASFLIISAGLSFFAPCKTKFLPFEEKDSNAKRFMQSGVNHIANGDFRDGGKSWDFFFQGGNATARYTSGQAKLSISSVGNVNYGVQYYHDGFRLYTGGKYTFKFTASASKPKGCEVRLQLNGGDYHAYVMDTYTFTREPKTFQIDFEMKEDSDAAPRLVFNMGTFPDRDDKSFPIEVVLSDVSLVLNNEILADEKGNGGADISRVNQVGWRPDDKKIAFIKVDKDGLKFDVLDSKKAVVFSGKLGAPVRDEQSHEYVAKADFTKFKTPGVYTVSVDGNESFPFTIGEKIYDDVLDSATRFFYLSRCGQEVVDDTFGHGPCHTGEARIHGTNDYAYANGGWHDAGDYGRYVGPGAKAAIDLLQARDVNGGDFSKTPILDEVAYELDWMLKMQREDGGVYHKITCLKFPPFVMPQFETEKLFICPVSTAATADFAAAMAIASSHYPDSAYLDAAKKAWAYLEQNDNAPFSNPNMVETGAYPDSSDVDERYFAAVALRLATGDEKYAEAAQTLRSHQITRQWMESYGWAQMEGYADELVALNPDKFPAALAATAKKSLLAAADRLVSIASASGFSLSMDNLIWGSNMEAMNNARLLSTAFKLSKKQKYLDAAFAQVNYIFGCNPVSRCYVTGFGTNGAKYPHHRPSIAMKKPQPGMLIGGPDEHLDDVFTKNVLEDKPPLKCYLDNEQSFSTNEITIYWNSALVYALVDLIR